MKQNFLLPIAGVAALGILAGCSENAWNDKLDGFSAEFKPTQVEKVEYTLTAADYSAIASNATNKALAADKGLAQALSALSGNKYFTDEITAEEFVPAFLAAASPFYVYSDGSVVNLTYNKSVGLPTEVTRSPGATMLTVSEDFYKAAVWGSDDDYINGFAPSKPFSRFADDFLQDNLPDAEEGDYAYVTYNVAGMDPVFGQVGGGDVPPASFTLSNVIGTMQKDQDVEINGLVSGACGAGFTLTDASGTIFVYMGTFDPATYALGTQINLVGKSTSFNSNLQIAQGATITVVGQQEYTLPTPTVLDGAALDAVLTRPADVPAEFVTLSGTIANNGKNINVIVAGAETAKGSVYYASEEQKALLADGVSATVTGWLVSISGGRYCNIVVDNLTVGSSSAPRRSLAFPVATTKAVALMQYDGSKWVVPAGFQVLQPSDYEAMGVTSLTSAQAASMLPSYLRMALPYAAKDDVKYVLYNGGESLACSYYIFNGSEWLLNKGVEEVSAQFVRAGGKWMYDPNVVINLPYGKGQAASQPFYQACVDWVYENKCVPLGDTSIKSGKFWVTSYGNNDYYCGASAYQNNIDLRAGSARAQYAEGWEGYTDEEIIATEEERCDTEVFPAVLAQLYPDAKPIDGIDVYYTINFYAYILCPDSKYKTLPCWSKYRLTAPGTFEYVESEWVIGFND